MSDPYRHFTLSERPTRTPPAPARAPDRRTILRSYLFGRLCALRAEMDGMRIGNESDARRFAELEAREDELRRLCDAVSIDPETCDWVPLR